LVGPDIAVDHDERGIPQQRQGLENTPAGFQRTGRFGRISNGDAEAPAIAQIIPDAFPEVTQIDHQFDDAGRTQGGDMPLDQRPAADVQQRFGYGVSQRAHPLTASGSQNHGPRGLREITTSQCHGAFPAMLS
jgi:hypothetical protein